MSSENEKEAEETPTKVSFVTAVQEASVANAGLVQEAIDSVMKDYTRQISELAQITATLPQRFHALDEKLLKARVSVAPANGSDSAWKNADSEYSSPILWKAVGTDSAPAIFSERQSEKSKAELELSAGARGSIHDIITSAHVVTALSESGSDDHAPLHAPKKNRHMIQLPTCRFTLIEDKIKEVVAGTWSKGGSRNSGLCKRFREACRSLFSHRLGKLDVPASKKRRPSVNNTFSLVAQGVRSKKFDLIVATLIVLNCITMIVQLEYVGYQHEVSLGRIEDDGSWQNADRTFLVIEHIFNALFILELVSRFAIFRYLMFRDKAALLDVFIVGASSVQIYVLDPFVLEDGEGFNWSFLRLLRFTKFVRAFRLVRVLHLFSALRILVKTIVSSFAALVWSMILLFLIMIMGGLFLSLMVKDFIQDSDNDLAQRQWVFKHYGTSSRAIYTLFEVTLAGCWPTYFRPLIHNVSGWYVLFALGYISFVVFAIIRIITAIFLKETLQIASNDAEMMVHERIKQKQVYTKKLERVFRAVDTSADGKLNMAEFSQIVSNPAVKVWLQVLELEVHDAHALFRLLDDGDGEVTYDEFLQGVLRLKGQARTMDIVAIINLSERMMKAIKHLRVQMDQVHDYMSVQSFLSPVPNVMQRVDL